MLISDMLNEVNRELSLRGQVFPKLIAQGRLTSGEADERVDRLEATRNVLLWLKRCNVKRLDELHNQTVVPISVNNTSEKVPQGTSIKGGV